MRHAKRNQRLSRPGDHRGALVHNLVKSLLIHGEIRTTYARAKEAQRLADRLVSLGKDGSIHARRQAFRILQNRTLVKQLFTDVAPSFVDVTGGYTRVLRLSFRRGDGAQRALLALSRQPALQPALPSSAKAAPSPQAPTAPKQPQAQPTTDAEKPKKFFEGLRSLWTRKKKGSAASSGSAR